MRAVQDCYDQKYQLALEVAIEEFKAQGLSDDEVAELGAGQLVSMGLRQVFREDCGLQDDL
jgi:hypothetical protein